MPTVLAYGADYSDRELGPEELDAYDRQHPDEQISVLLRYIGYPDNPKCISCYPGAYQRHVDAGRTVLLVAQQGWHDAAEGYQGGQARARLALEDARRIGYPEDLPIFMASDRWLGPNPERGWPAIPLGTAMAYLDGAASVLGRERTGAYGFRDFVYPAQDGAHAWWLWLCGDEAGVRDGIQFYQWNGGTLSIGGVPADLNKVYVDLSNGGGFMSLSNQQQAALAAMADQYLPGEDGVRGAGRMVLWLNDRFTELSAQNAALTAAVQAMAGGATTDQLRQYIDEAVARHVQVTVEVAGKPGA
ncbi:glycoside hydrolase domain-containing protein [Kutzneria albida]|uniref:Rv2525c-like glycoside hydrolase-like domain-containing protein n=1 Tax=Kutzneria albida DSM 43870 TaxID=1449976 RepID=W5WBB7_9PSEU|nr:glycoside hydrolase domain-containing protein [Kutzneria albida]AHH97826.1 hypothetical protein KALB_4464 [Kutzneria albida DSM 43870]